MIPPNKKNPGDKGGVRRKIIPVGFTMVEMVVALGVACILMVAVVAFLVNGVVSTTKTTSINDTTTKGRYVFEHLSREMSRANDLTVSNFTSAPLTPTPSISNFKGFNYFISVEDRATTPTSTTPVTSSSISLNLPAATPPDNLIPQQGDYIKLPGIDLGTNGVMISGATGSPSGGLWTITVGAPFYTLAGVASDSPDIPANAVATILRQRSYQVQSDPSTGDTQLWWYPNTTNLPQTMVVAKGLPTNPDGTPQYPFTAVPKVASTDPNNPMYVGINLALTTSSTERIQITPTVNVNFKGGVLAGQTSFYSNNTINAVFANRSTATTDLI